MNMAMEYQIRRREVVDRHQLDLIAKIVTYLYHDKRKEYEKIASDKRKAHIYNDIKDINQWLSSQYKRLEREDAKKRKSK